MFFTKTGLLSRESLPVLTPGEVAEVGDRLVEVGISQLAEEAEKLLGYRQLKSYQEKSRPGRQDKTRLAEVLKELDVKPLEKTGVKKFQARRLWRLNGRLTLWVLMVSLGLMALFLVGWMVAGQVTAQWLWNLHCGWSCLASFVGVFMTLVYAGARGHIAEGIAFDAHQWVRRGLSDFQDPIPEFALATAVTIKKRLPEASFSVEYLQQDPFLRVALGSSDIVYLEYWNEPDFKAQREV